MAANLARNPQAQFEARIRHVAAAGIELPPDIDQLRQRLKDFHRGSGSTPMRDRLAEAIITADPTADMPLLWAAALAESNAATGIVAELHDGIRLQINRAIRACYAEVALPTYLAIAAKFDTAAQALTAAAAVVDVEAPADVAIAYPTKQQQAWRDAAVAVADLHRLIPALKAAAVLAEVCDDDPDHDLPLAVDPADLPRREVWHAWDTDHRDDQTQRRAKNAGALTVAEVTRSRTGRWGALLRLGATLRACPPEVFTPYRRPARLIERTVDGKRRLVDPDADDYQPPQPPRFVSPRVRVG